MVSLEEQVERLQARLRELEGMLGQNDNRLAVTYGLPPKMADLLGLLLSVEVVTPEMVQTTLSLATDTRVAIHRLRAYLEPYGIVVYNARGLGYRLNDETKARITQRVTNGDR